MKFPVNEGDMRTHCRSLAVEPRKMGWLTVCKEYLEEIVNLLASDDGEQFGNLPTPIRLLSDMNSYQTDLLVDRTRNCRYRSASWSASGIRRSVHRSRLTRSEVVL